MAVEKRKPKTYLSTATMKKLAIHNLDTLHPRVRVDVGVTIPVDRYTFVKPGLSLEVDVGDGDTIEGTIEAVTDALMDKLSWLEDRLAEYVEGEGD